MTNILENELVRKYFDKKWGEGNFAWNVIESMQQPIRKGERYLFVKSNGFVCEQINSGDNQGGMECSFHAHVLRLPDRF